MSSSRKRAANPPQPPARLTRLADAQASPRSGKTTRLGTRAERPSEISERKGATPATEPSRSKAPSPQAGAQHEGPSRDADLPQAARDHTA